MAIAPLPTPPSRGDSANFAARGDALLSALPAFVAEANALQEDVSAKQATASEAAVTATEAAGISVTKAGQASDSEAAAFSYKGAAEQAASDANLSKIAAALSSTAAANSAASVDAQGFATDYAGPTEPLIKWPYMTWADTLNMLLKRRNAANTDWVILGSLFPSAHLRNGLDGLTADVMLNGAAVAKIDQYGVSSANAPAVSAYSNANQGFTAGPRTKVLFGAKHFDTDGCFNNSTFTAKRPGMHCFGSFVKVTGTSLGVIAADIFKNGVLFEGGDISPVGGASGRVFVGGSIALQAGETIDIYAFATSGGNLAFTSSGVGDACTFSAHFVRPLP